MLFVSKSGGGGGFLVGRAGKGCAVKESTVTVPLTVYGGRVETEVRVVVVCETDAEVDRE